MQSTTPAPHSQSTTATWQYIVDETRDSDAMQQLLDVRGAEGWELVNAIRREPAPVTRKTGRFRSTCWTLFFKRAGSSPAV